MDYMLEWFEEAHFQVAAMGLNPHLHLGKNLAELQPVVQSLNSRFGINICGEGGEYETLALDCPLFKSYRISLDEFHIVQHSPDTIAPVGVLHPSKFHLECKTSTLTMLQPTLVPVVKDIGVQFEESFLSQNLNNVSSTQIHESVLRYKSDVLLDFISVKHGAFAVYSCWTKLCLNDLCIEEELGFILTSLQDILYADGLNWGSVLYIHLYLNDMNMFSLANQTYMQVITESLCTNGVPSRSTVGIDLLESNLGRIMVEAVVTTKPYKKVLHVQSISCWAPSCIGPYSQATLCCDMLYMAGQLGLDSPTMTLVHGGAPSEMKQALKNCEAVAQAFSASIINSCVSILVYCASSIGLAERKDAATVLENFMQSTKSVSCSMEVPVLFVQVQALPKWAEIEVEPFLYTPSGDMESSNPILALKRFKKRELFQSTSVPGQFLRAFCSVPLKGIVEDFTVTKTISALGFESLPSICGELEFSLQAFSKELDEACFNWENVLAFRLMFASKIISRELLQEAWSTAVNNCCHSREDRFSTKVSMSGLQYVQPLFLPVLNSGLDMDMGDLVTLDLLAFP